MGTTSFGQLVYTQLVGLGPLTIPNHFVPLYFPFFEPWIFSNLALALQQQLKLICQSHQ